MRSIVPAVVVAVVVAAVAFEAGRRSAPAEGDGEAARPEFVLLTQHDRMSYAWGYDVGPRLTGGPVSPAAAPFARGVRDAMEGAEPAMAESEREQALAQLQEDITRAIAAQNLARAKEFLAENAGRDGVVALTSGLQYKVAKPGDGETPGPDSQVTVHYRGRLLNGQEFDSSYSRGQPARFVVGQVIEGWQQALQLMEVGARWQLFIPPDLAYGETGAPPMRTQDGRSIPSPIGPNELLIFDVELLGVQAPPPTEEGEQQ
jgi:FKBP-type peptidyl-prolyl cis-trans isomerase